MKGKGKGAAPSPSPAAGSGSGKVAKEPEAQSALASVIETACLFLIAAVAFSIRLFSIVKYESVIHEFDPYFNYRVTQLASEKGRNDRDTLNPLRFVSSILLVVVI